MSDKPIRRDSSARLRQDADFEDIISAFNMPEENNAKWPTFAVLKLDRLHATIQ